MTRLIPAAVGGAQRPARPQFFVAAALGTLLAGCTHMQAAKIDRHVIVGSVPEDYRTTHPIAVEEGVETLDVPAGINTVRLNDAIKGNIAGFVRGFVDSGSAAIAIVTPAGSANEASARALASQIQAVALAGGVDPKEIEFRT